MQPNRIAYQPFVPPKEIFMKNEHILDILPASASFFFDSWFQSQTHKPTTNYDPLIEHGKA